MLASRGGEDPEEDVPQSITATQWVNGEQAVPVFFFRGLHGRDGLESELMFF